MAVCYFDDKYEEKYNWLYEVKDNVIEVTVDYNIMDEIPAINGIRSYGSYRIKKMWHMIWANLQITSKYLEVPVEKNIVLWYKIY